MQVFSKQVDRAMVYLDYFLRNYRFTLWLAVTLMSAWMISDAIRDIRITPQAPPIHPQQLEMMSAPAPAEVTTMAILALPAKKERPKAKAVTAEIYKTGNEEVDAYIRRFIKVARIERQKFGIPISIKIGQGILESRYGTGEIATKANNHFGMKCWGGCPKFINIHDDHPNDKFKVYASAWESWRDHSIKLNGSRYRHLHKLKATDYKGWARGLKKAGYATDKRYAQSLTKVIETYKLQKYDVDFEAGR